MPIPVAARSKAWVCGRSLAGAAISNPAGGWGHGYLFLVSVLCRAGRGLCVGLITHPEESECGREAYSEEALVDYGLLFHVE